MHLFWLDVDESAVHADAVLLQEDDNRLDRPTCYYSKKFHKYQVSYSMIEKETLALLLAYNTLKFVLSYSAPLVIYTDHNPLVFLVCMYNHNQRLMRWALAQRYNLDIGHKKGSNNVIADALSHACTD